MRHDHCWRLRYSFVAVIAAATLIVVLQAHGATQIVTIRGGQVQKDNKLNIPTAGADASTAAMFESVYSTIFIHSKTFVPPNDWSFMKFPSSNTHVDISLGAVYGLSPLRWTDTNSAIELRATYLEGVQASHFPLQCEGNLKPNGGGGGGAGGQPPQKHWAAKVKDEMDQGRLRIVPSLNDPLLVPYVFRSNPTITLSVLALSASGEPQDNIHVNLKATTDVGQLPNSNPFAQGNTSAPVANVNHSPPMYDYDGTLHAPDTLAKTYTITATANGYLDDTIELKIVSAQWVQHNKYKGFDDTTSPPWLVVGVGQTSTGAKLKLEQGAANVAIAMSNNAKATIQPAQSNGAETNTDVTGVQAASGLFAKATDNNNAVITKLNVEVKKVIPVNVKFVFVKDTHNPPHDGSIPIATVNAIFAKAQERWGDQAAISLKQKGTNLVQTWTYSGDLGDSPTLQAFNAALDSDGNAPAPNPSSNDIYIYIVPGLDLPGATVGVTQRRKNSRNYTITVGKSANEHTYLHEIGHALGCQAHSEYKSDIMYPTLTAYANDEVVHKRIADLVNPN